MIKCAIGFHAALLFGASIVAFACSAPAASAPSAVPASTTSFIANGDVRLAFDVDLPTGTPPFPAVVLGHGAGQITRQALKPEADLWTAMGFAVLRFDKRGVGESSGTYFGITTGNSQVQLPLLASDVEAAVRYLRSRADINPRKIGMFGASQAGWILPLAARNLGDSAFVVLVSGPVCSVGLEIRFEDINADGTLSIDAAYDALSKYQGPPGFDIVPALTSLSSPSLWLLGEADRTVPVRTTTAALTVLRTSGRPFDWITYPGLGHGLDQRIWSDVASWVSKFR